MRWRSAEGRPKATAGIRFLADSANDRCSNAGRGDWKATTTFVPIEQYLRTSYRPDADYVDGVVEERNLGQNDHSAWQTASCAWFRDQAQSGDVGVRPELRVRVAAMRLRNPDVALIDRNWPQEPVATVPPVAVFEVISPDDRMPGLWSDRGL